MLGSLPLLSFRVGGVEPSDNITRKFAFKVRNIPVEGEWVLGAVCNCISCRGCCGYWRTEKSAHGKQMGSVFQLYRATEPSLGDSSSLQKQG